MTDILSGGPDPARYGRQRRSVTVAAGVVLAGAAVLVATRSAPGREGQPPLPTTAPSTVPATRSAVAAVAVGTNWAYALVSTCAERAVPVCSYRLRRRDLGGTGWTDTPLQTDPRTPGRCGPGRWSPARAGCWPRCRRTMRAGARCCCPGTRVRPGGWRR